MRMKDIAEENRPRERVLKKGPDALSDAELLAIILQNGTKKHNVVDMSHILLIQHGMAKLADISLKELQEIEGIGPTKAMQIKALFEFNKRFNLNVITRVPVQSAKDVFEYAKNRLPSNDKEYFMALYLDSKNRVIKDETISVGTLNSSLIHPREVFKAAIKESANAVIFVHNHPSGDPAPSEEDEQITEKLFEAGELLGIKVLDHVIIGQEGYHSFKDKK